MFWGLEHTCQGYLLPKFFPAMDLQHAAGLCIFSLCSGRLGRCRQFWRAKNDKNPNPQGIRACAAWSATPGIGIGRTDPLPRGLHNLSASLDVAISTFPSPRRIVLTGVSAGAFGTTYALPLVRTLYPDVPIDLVNDSGIGLGRIDEPEFITKLLTEWNATAFFPESCDTCIGDDGHTTDYHKYQLEEDDNLRLGMMSYTRDTVIAVTFVQVGGEAFEAALLEELDDLEAAYPERVKSFVAAGPAHTFLLGDLNKTGGGVTVADWVSSMLDGDGWETTRD